MMIPEFPQLSKHFRECLISSIAKAFPEMLDILNCLQHIYLYGRQSVISLDSLWFCLPLILLQSSKPAGKPLLSDML